jgi:hypothetical protein
MDDAIALFRATAHRLFPEKVVGFLCIIEHSVQQHEACTGKPVMDFGGYLAAIHSSAQLKSFDSESRTWFDMWQRVRRPLSTPGY